MSEVVRAGAPDQEITDAMLEAGVSVLWDCCVSENAAFDFDSFAPEKFPEFVRRIFEAMLQARYGLQNLGQSRERLPLSAPDFRLPE